jgi:hypothetical protein
VCIVISLPLERICGFLVWLTWDVLFPSSCFDSEASHGPSMIGFWFQAYHTGAIRTDTICSRGNQSSLMHQSQTTIVDIFLSLSYCPQPFGGPRTSCFQKNPRDFSQHSPPPFQTETVFSPPHSNSMLD